MYKEIGYIIHTYLRLDEAVNGGVSYKIWKFYLHSLKRVTQNTAKLFDIHTTSNEKKHRAREFRSFQSHFPKQ
jgi:hypothetical protein